MPNPYDDLVGAPDSANPYDDLLTQQTRGKVRASAVAVRGRNPDAYARAEAIAQRNGWPTQVVADNFDQFAEREQLDKLDALDTDAPELASWLSDPGNMAVASDDIDNLRDMAISLRPNGTVQATPEPSWLAENVSQFRGGLVRGKNYIESFLFDAPSTIDPGVARGLGYASVEDYEAGQAAVRFAQGNRRAEGIEQLSEATRREMAEIAAASGWMDSAATVVTSPRALSVTIAQSLGQGAPVLAATGAASIFGPAGTASAAGGGAFALEYGNSVAGAMEQQGVDTTDAASVRAFLSSPARMRAAREHATRRGVPIAAFSALTAGLAGRLLAGANPTIASVAGRSAGEAGLQAAGGAAGEAAAQTVTGEPIRPADIIMEAVAEIPTSVAEVPGNYLAIRRKTEEVAGNVVTSLNDSDRLAKITELAKASKVAGRSPRAVEQLAPDETIYIPAEAVRTLYQNGDPATFVAELTGDPEAFAAAGEHGDIAIPLAKWVSTVSRLSNAEEFAANARTKVDGYSRADLESLDMDAELGALEATEEAADTSNDVQQDVLAQLLAAGTYTPADAELQASVTAKVFGTLAARTGQDAKALYDRYQLRIAGPEPSLAERTVARVRKLFQRKPIGDQLADRWAGDFDSVAAEYAALTGEFDSNGGQVLNTDLARELSPEYRADRTRSADVHEAASGFVKELYRRKLSQPTPEGVSPTVVLSAGGTGAGKTTGLRAIDFGTPEIIYDTNANKLSSSVTKIEQALAAGREVKVVYTYRDPVEALRNGALPRAMRMAVEQGTGRTVPLIEHARTHVGASKVIRQLADRYKNDERVEIVAIDNSRGRNNAAIVPLESLPEVEHSNVYENLRAALEEARAAGEISDAVYRGFAEPPAHAKGLGTADRGQSEQADSRQELTPPNGGVSVLEQPADGGGFDPRGQLEIGDGRKMTVRLLAGADRSTFIHEMGHFFLEVLQDIASESSDVAGDLAAIREWVGNDGGPFTTEQHEQFARGFEAYLFEGKAPSPELVSAFARFRAWLVSLYRDMKALNVTLTDDVRGVFDRLIATEEEIEAAQVKQGMAPMVTQQQGRELGLSDAQWEAYVAALEAGAEEARQEVAQKLLKAHQRQQEAAYKEERAKVREEVEAETEVAPAVRAWRILAGAERVNGEEVPDTLRDLHLDPETILPDDREAIKGMGVTRKTGGVAPDTAAMLLGFPSGDALVQALAGVRGLQDQIDMEVDRRMEGRYPDPIRELSTDAMVAVHNHKRVAAMQAELDLLAQVSGQPRPNRRQLKAIAEARIKALKIRELRPASHLAAERKAARAAMQAAGKGDFAEALKAKREQMLHAALYTEAMQARSRVERQVKYARRFDKTSTRQRIGKAGNDLLEMIDGVLAAYSFRPVSDKARERGATLRKWYDRMVEQGVEPNVPDAVLQQIEAARLTHYRELTVSELDGVVEVVKQLEHQAREANTIRLGEIEAELEQAETDLAGAIRGGLKDRGPPPISETLTKRFPHKAGKAYRLAGAWLLRLRTLAQWVDGEGNVDGAFHRLIVRPLDRAQAAYRDAMLDYGKRVSDLFDTYLKDQDISGDIWIASLGQNLTKSDILAVALNTGNASNLQRLKDGRRWGDVQMADILSHMTQRDWEFVQATWDTLESLWPKIAEQQKRLTGIAPPKIEATPVVTPFGTYAGGYYPVVYDRDSAEYKSLAGDNDDSFFDPVALSALPANGHTKTRVQKAKIPIKLDLAVVPQHLSSILKDLTHRETVLGIRKLIRQPAVAESLRETLGTEFAEMIETKLRQVATDQVVQGGRLWNAASKLSRGVRRHVGIMAQGFAVTSGLKQIIGLSNSMEVLTARHGKRAAPLLALGTRRALTPGGVEAVMAMSGEMRHRLNTADTDIRLNMNRYLSGKMDGSLKGKLSSLHDGAVAHAYILIQYVQTYAVDMPLWLAAHEGALRNGLEGDAAIAAADDAVITAQGAGGAKDTALIEGQIPFLEWLTMFYSYASAYLNRQVSMGRQMAKAREGGMGTVIAELPLLSARVMFLVALPVVMEEIINQMSGASDGPGDEDEDGDQDAEDQARYYAERMGAYLFYGIPGLRDIVGSKYGYRLSPVQSVPESYMRLTKDVERLLEGDDVENRKIARDAVNVIGYTLGLPLAGPWKHIDYLWRVLEGEEQPESVPEFAAAVALAKREQR